MIFDKHFVNWLNPYRFIFDSFLGAEYLSLQATSSLTPSVGPYKVLSSHMKHGPNLKLWGTLSNFKVLQVKLLGQMPQTVSRSDKDDEVEIIEETPEKTSQVDN